MSISVLAGAVLFVAIAATAFGFFVEVGSRMAGGCLVFVLAYRYRRRIGDGRRASARMAREAFGNALVAGLE